MKMGVNVMSRADAIQDLYEEYYNELIKKLANHYDLIYIVGHPSFVRGINDHQKVINMISSDNKKMLEVCANANCLISQHSGVIYLSAILQKPYVLLYKGGKSPSDIGSFNNTLLEWTFVFLNFYH